MLTPAEYERIHLDMSNAAKTHRLFFSWHTTKHVDGTFSFDIAKNIPQSEALPNGRYCVTETVKTETGFKTRARAKGRGMKWLRHFRANA